MLTGSPVLESEATVPRDVVGMGVCLDHANDPHLVALSLGEQRLDRIGGIDGDRDPASSSPIR